MLDEMEWEPRIDQPILRTGGGVGAHTAVRSGFPQGDTPLLMNQGTRGEQEGVNITRSLEPCLLLGATALQGRLLSFNQGNFQGAT